jgi:hypothetical protein
MPSLMATLGLNNSSFRAKLDESKSLAKQGGKEIQKGLNGEGAEIKSGAARELLVLVREIGRGDFKRAAGSFTLLLQNLGAMSLLMNPITAAVIGLGAGIFAAWKFSTALVEKLSGLKVPDFNPEHIAKHLQKINQAAEAQKEINREVRKTEELYDSAAKSAERFAGVLKEHFDHQRKMNTLAMDNELALAKTEQERQAIRKKYSDQELAINARERAEEVRNKMQERMDLDDEAARKKKQGDSISVNSAEHDKQLLDQKKKMAEEAEKYLADVNSQGLGAKAKDAAITGFNKVALSGVSGNDLKKAEADNRAEAQRRIQAYKSQVDTNADNDALRKQKEELYKGAGQSASKAAELGKEIPDLIRSSTQKNADEASEAAAKLAGENAKDQSRAHGNGRADVNALQRIGAYAGGHDPKEDLLRQGNRSLERIEKFMETVATRGQGGVGFE